jgi:hypothetical protein
MIEYPCPFYIPGAFPIGASSNILLLNILNKAMSGRTIE